MCLRDVRGKSWIVQVGKERKFDFDKGRIDLESLIGCPFGSVVEIEGWKPVYLLRPGPADYLHRFRKVTQILYPDDCAIIIGTSGVGSGDIVVEAGTGSGGLTSYLAYHVRPTGHVFSYDNEQQHLEVATENLRLAGLEEVVTFHCNDITQGFIERNVDKAFLDLARPWEGAIRASEVALKPGGILTVFVPNWSQVEKSVAAIQAGQFLLLETFEIFRRNLKVDLSLSIMRPETRFTVAYSGVIITAVKLASKTTFSNTNP